MRWFTYLGEVGNGSRDALEKLCAFDASGWSGTYAWRTSAGGFLFDRAVVANRMELVTVRTRSGTHDYVSRVFDWLCANRDNVIWDEEKRFWRLDTGGDSNQSSAVEK